MSQKAHDIAVAVQRGFSSLGLDAYSHPPIPKDEESSFTILQDGWRYKVTVREITPEEELAAAMRGERV